MLLTLSKALAAELKNTFEHVRLQDRDGNMRPIRGYRQRFPKQTKLARADASTDPIPGYLVVWDSLEESKDGKTEIATFLVDFAVRNDSDERAGADDIMLLIDLIRERFGKNPYLGIFRKTGPLKSAPQIESTGDYFTGGLQIKFEVPMYRKNDPKEGSGYEQWQQERPQSQQVRPPRRRTP